MLTNGSTKEINPTESKDMSILPITHLIHFLPSSSTSSSIFFPFGVSIFFSPTISVESEGCGFFSSSTFFFSSITSTYNLASATSETSLDFSAFLAFSAFLEEIFSASLPAFLLIVAFFSFYKTIRLTTRLNNVPFRSIALCDLSSFYPVRRKEKAYCLDDRTGEGDSTALPFYQ